MIFLFGLIINVNAQSDTTKYPPNCDKIIPALNFKDSDLRDVLRSVAFEYHVNIVIDNRISAHVSTALFNVSVFDAVRMIARDNNLDFFYDAQRLYIKPLKEKDPPSPPDPEPEIAYTNNKLSLSLNNVDIHKLINGLRKHTGKNYLLSSGASGRLTGDLKNVELVTGLKNILQNNGFYFTVKDSIFYIARSDYFSSMENSEQSKRGSYWVSAQNGKVTLNIVQTNLDKVLTDIANQMNLQIVKLTVPNCNVTVRCNDISLNRALSLLFRGTEFTFKEEKGAYVIGNRAARGVDDVRLYRFHYLRAEKIKDIIPQSMTQNVSVNVSSEHNAIILTGPDEFINNIEDYLGKIDKPVPQVLIEALVVDYNLDNTLQYGINAGRGDSTMRSRADKYYPGIDITASGQKINKLLKDVGTVNLFGKDLNVGKLGKLPENFYVNIKALEEKGIVNVKSRPILSTLNGHTASLKIGTVQNYIFNEILPVTNQLSSSFLQKETIQKIEANVSFEVTPWVGPDGEITMEIKPDFQTPIGEFVPDKKLIPAINTRSFQSTVRMNDGETIILGGLIQDTESNTEYRVPFLGSIPFIGKLFTNVDKKKGKAELLIYLTPRIFYTDEFGNQSEMYK